MTTEQRFAYHRPHSAEEATALVEAGGTPLGGGTDLLGAIKDGLLAPSALVDLRHVAGGRTIRELPGGTLRIGAAVGIAELAESTLVLERYPALAQACRSVGTPALRNMGTLGGNLCQRPRCWYFRGEVPCLKNGGTGCPARTGENQYHAIIGGGPCWIVHPSDPAVALTALDAIIETVGANGTGRRIPITEFFVLPSERMDQETVLERGEIVAAVELPAGAAGGYQRYTKLMQRGAWDFALVSLAVAKRTDGGVRLVLGGVAPKPWRVNESVEEDAGAGALDDADIETLADRALYDAVPLAKNAYKVTMATTLLRRALADVARA